MDSAEPKDGRHQELYIVAVSISPGAVLDTVRHTHAARAETSILVPTTTATITRSSKGRRAQKARLVFLVLGS